MRLQGRGELQRSHSMLILVLRVAFVTFAVLVGMTAGDAIYPRWAPSLPPWFGGAMGLAVSSTMIALEQAFRRSQRAIIAFQLGMALGLGLTWLVLSVLRRILENAQLYSSLCLPVSLITLYIVIITVLRNIDRWRVVIPFVEFRTERIQGGPLILDATSLQDGRLLGLAQAGLITDRVILHRTVLAQLEQEARSVEPAAQARARRALDNWADLRTRLGVAAELDQSEVPNVERPDDVLIRLCRLENGRLMSQDRPLLQRAQAEGVPTVDLYSLGAALAPQVRTGEVLTVLIERAGDARGQGVGFLADGSMVVVAGGAEHISQNVRVTVLRTHTTANGRMVFAEMANG